MADEDLDELVQRPVTTLRKQPPSDPNVARAFEALLDVLLYLISLRYFKKRPSQSAEPT
jgi:hypothetical protein